MSSERRRRHPSATILTARNWARRLPPASFGRFRKFLFERERDNRTARQAIIGIRSSELYAGTARAGLSPEETLVALAEFLGLPRLSELALDRVDAQGIPRAFCIRNGVLPVQSEDDSRFFVIGNPFNWNLLKLLGDTLGEDARFGLALELPDRIEERLADLTSEAEDPSPAPTPERVDTVDVRSVLAEVLDESENQDKSQGRDLQQAKGDHSPLARLARGVLESAVQDRASDVHIEPKKGKLSIRFRIDGDMRERFELPTEVGVRVIARLKAIGGLDISEKRAPQDGAVAFKVLGRELKLRLATTSTPNGESMVIRVLDPSKKPPALAELGMLPEQASDLAAAAGRHQGLILLVGATGSGKTTTIYSLMHAIDCQSRSLMTVEDPIEYRIAFANQQQVNIKAGVTFEALLKSAMRQDPDILYLGEIRDPFSAKTAMDFSSSGHLSISTIHASNATNLIPRLERLGVDRGTMAESITCTTSQRLLKKPCDHCKRIEAPTDQEKDMLEDYFGSAPERVVHVVGCERCQGGYSGREGVYEVVLWTPSMRKLVAEGASVDQLREALAEDGALLFRDHARRKIEDLSIPPMEAYHKVLVDEPRLRRSPAPAASEPAPAASEPAPAASEPAPAPPTPAATPALAPREPGATASQEAPAARILLAEDDHTTGMIVRTLLTKEGYEVDWAQDGADALILLGKGQYDLVITDLNMPNLNGFQLMEILVNKNIEIPLLVVSSDTSEEAELRALEIGALDVLAKPINLRKFGARVKRQLRRGAR